MKEERLLRTLGDIDDDLIAEARPTGHRIRVLRWSAAAAAAVLVATAVALLPWEPPAGIAPESDQSTANSPTNGEDTEDTAGKDSTTTANANAEAGNTTTGNTTTKKAWAEGTTGKGNTTTVKPTWIKPTATKPVPEIALVPKWEDKTNKQKYPEIPYGAATYSVYYAIDPKQVGEKLTTVTATGQDVYTDTYHTTAVTLYQLADIAPQCAVAIQYEGDDDYYSAVATWYQPLTLGEFLEGLQLKKYGKFGTASWDYFDEVYHYRTYTGVTIEAVFDLLLDDRTLANVHDNQQHFYDTINISVDLPILGLENKVVMSLSEDGYLFTNILGCGKTFYVGTARVEAFKDYLQKHCECTVRAVTTQTVTEPTNTQPPGTVTGTTSSKAAQPPRTSVEKQPK